MGEGLHRSALDAVEVFGELQIKSSPEDGGLHSLRSEDMAEVKKLVHKSHVEQKVSGEHARRRVLWWYTRSEDFEHTTQ